MEMFVVCLLDVDVDYLCMGDFGFVSDGGVFINGCLKELIIVCGCNFYL